MPTLVLGATGRLGGLVTTLLQSAGEQVKIVVRNPRQARQQLGGLYNRVEVFVGDIGDPGNVATAASGADRLFIATSGVDMYRNEISAVEVASTAGVKRVVKVSGLGAAKDSVLPMGRDHFGIEQRVRELGMACASLRSSLMMHNLAESSPFVVRGELPAAAGHHRIGWVHPKDIADIAATLLLDDAPTDFDFDVTGGEALSYTELSQRFTCVLDRSVQYVPLTDADYDRELSATGRPAWVREHLVAIYRDMVRKDAFDVVTDVVPKVSGEPCRTVDEWIAENRSIFTR